MNYLPLETYRQEIDYHPYHFWQQSAGKSSVALAELYEFRYQQTNRVSRDEMARAIKGAHDQMRPWVGFELGQKWVSKRVDLGGAGYVDTLELRTGIGYLRTLGTKVETVLAEAGNVVYSDENGDQVNDTFTVTLTGITEPPINAVLYGDSRHNDGRIADISADYDSLAQTLTITGPSWQMVKQDRLSAPLKTDLIDPGDTADFINTVRVVDEFALDGDALATAAVVMCWRQGWPSTATYVEADKLAYQVVDSPVIIDEKRGEIRFACYARRPDYVLVNGLAGARFEGGWGTAVAALATARMGHKFPKEASTAHHWAYDLSNTARGEELYATNREIMSCQFGQRRGALEAWRKVKAEAYEPGVVVAG